METRNPLLWTYAELLDFLIQGHQSRRQGKRWLRDRGGAGTAEELDHVLIALRSRADFGQATIESLRRLTTTQRAPVEYLVASDPQAFPAIEQAREHRAKNDPEASIYRARRVE